MPQAYDRSRWSPPRLKTTRQGDEVTIVRDHRNGCLALFLGVWLTGWTIGCCVMTWSLFFGKGDVPWMLPIPFYVAEIGVFLFVLSNLTHREFARLDREGFTYWRSIVFALGRHHIPIDELESFTVTAQNLDSDGKTVDAKTNLEKLAAKYGAIHAEGIGMPFPFFGAVSAEDAREATKELNSVLAILRPTVPKTSASAAPRAPAGSAWRQTNEDDCVRFIRSSRSTFSSILVTLGIALFWNGITGIFTALEWGWIVSKDVPKGKDWWFLFFFLIPFQLIGAFLLYALASTIYEWLAIESWRLYRNRLEMTKSLLGIRVGTTSYDNIDCVRLDCLPEVEPDKTAEDEAGKDAPPAKPEPTTSSDLPPVTHEGNEAKPPMTFFPDGQPIEVEAPEKPKTQTWKIVFVKRDETPMVEWTGLSFGEARWLGSVVLRERPQWFQDSA
jgi:hypothetical protein